MVKQLEEISNGPESDNAKKLEERKSEATSDKTLSDLEESGFAYTKYIVPMPLPIYLDRVFVGGSCHL